MAIEAPLSRYKRNNFKIYIAVCLIAAAWFAYDGYLNEGFIAKNTDAQGKANADLVINRVAPPFLVAGAVLLGVYFYAIRNRKLVADDHALVVAGKETIPYDAIERIDKTHFDRKGFFTVAYKRGDGREVQRKLSDRQYDNLAAILDHLVTKIT
jgi:hypothetical protein